MAVIFTAGKFQAIGPVTLANGSTTLGPVPSALLYTMAAGTSWPGGALATFTDQGGGSSNTNPVECDGNGQANVWLGTAAYRMTLKTAAGVTIWDVDNIANDSLASSAISFIQSGTGAVATTVQAKLREWPSVKDFGAVGDRATNDTAAFTLAQTASTYVRVPEGMVCIVSPGLNYWQFYGDGVVIEDGQYWQLNRVPQTEAMGKVYRQRTYGTFEDAVGDAVSINSSSAQDRTNVQVNGTTTAGMAINGEYGHVARYTQAYSFEPDSTSAATTYTSTSLSDANVSTYNVTAGRIKPGMFVKTKHASAYTGRIQSVVGNVITVDGWYLVGTGVAGTPANATGALINPNTKIWGMNINVFPTGTASNNQAQKAAGIELDISCDASVGTGVWGYDVVTTGGKPEMHYVSRGSRTYGVYQYTGADYAFATQTNGVGFESRDSVAADFSTTVASVQKWAVLQGMLGKDYRAMQTSASTVAISTSVSFVLASGTAQTYTLETPVGKLGRAYTIRSLNSNTLSTAAGLIDGAATKAMSANTTYGVISDNTNWQSF